MLLERTNAKGDGRAGELCNVHAMRPVRTPLHAREQLLVHRWSRVSLRLRCGGVAVGALGGGAAWTSSACGRRSRWCLRPQCEVSTGTCRGPLTVTANKAGAGLKGAEAGAVLHPQEGRSEALSEVPAV